MIEDGLRYQTQGDDWLERVLIGGIVGFLGVFVVPAFTFSGYMLEVMRRVMGGDTKNPPEWGDLDLVEMTVDGLRYVALTLVYGLAFALVAGLPILVFLLGGYGTDSGVLVGFGLLLGGLLYLLGLLALAVVLPVATANFVAEDSIGAGFDTTVLRDVVANGTMLKAIVFGVVINVIVQVVGSVLLFTLVGILLLPFVGFVGQSAVMYVWARGFADAYEEEYGRPPLEGPTASVGGGVGTTGFDAETGVDTDADEGHRY
ncbi:DUF4013 domain-containing protein [Haloarcula nitratireducens]|uniref:DUF4013 domain-containing protein n=1 Tax=Haloarcula nitratireducens TaxID=2487749 RepID=A0AAW4PC99_9EURY|nr:DUF4013 domain-containing protein [Halomicroarcula nitratireducens]MBX0295085.1 DUF4013 domain-containing protein [Halomicroarcula nitratireducens]